MTSVIAGMPGANAHSTVTVTVVVGKFGTGVTVKPLNYCAVRDSMVDGQEHARSLAAPTGTHIARATFEHWYTRTG